MNYHLIIIFLFCSLSLFSQEKGVSPLPSTLNPPPSTEIYAVVVGISDYQDEGIPDLRFADKDAEAFANFLRSPAGGSLDEDHLKVLINDQATQAQFAGALDWLWEVAQENDRAIIYFSGHGDVEKKSLTQPGFLLCWDAPSRVYMAGGAFPLNMLQEVISTISVQNKAKVIMVADACRSGKLSGSTVGGAQITGSNLAKQYANEIKILSCQPDEYSIEGEQWGGGRGAFSYHLLDGLYGMADGNQDNSVNLLEIGRYLEDKVTTEVAPQSQIPMTVGNRGEKLADVFPEILAQLKESRKSQIKLFAATNSKGIEDETLALVDSTVVELYNAFISSLTSKNFFEPANACADFYYEKLYAEPQLQPIHSSLKRNYAAALQDDAQQAINIWLKADVQELNCIGKSLRLEPIPKYLGRAAELLGEGHYMYHSLLARKLTFEGVLCKSTILAEEDVNRRCLELFKKSADMEPELPINWMNMGLIYQRLEKKDSAFLCARMANSLAPGWVLPFVDLSFGFIYRGNYEDAFTALQEATAIDSLHPYVLNQWGVYLTKSHENNDVERGFDFFEQYRDNGGAMYPCWYANYGQALLEAKKFDEAEVEIRNAMEMDSLYSEFWYMLADVYIYSNRLEQAIPYLEKAIELDSNVVKYWNNLSYVYIRLKLYEVAKPIILKLLEKDSTHLPAWNNLANVYRLTQQYEEAEKYYLKAISIDPDFFSTYVNFSFMKLTMDDLDGAFKYLKIALEKGFRDYNMISQFYKKIEERPEHKEMMKKYFPDQVKD